MLNISIIIVNYNCFDILTKCLETLFLYNSDQEFEVIIIDNASSDGDIGQYVHENNKIKIIKNGTNLGFSKANNQGLQIATGKYVLFLNNDIYFLEDSLKKILEFGEKQNGDFALGCKLLNLDGSWQASSATYPSALNSITSNLFLYKIHSSSPIFNQYYLQNKIVNDVVQVDYVLGAFLFGKRNTFLKLGGFDDRFFFYSEDIDLCYRIKKNGGMIFFFPYTSVTHIGGASVSQNAWFKFKNKSISLIQFYQKNLLNLKFFTAISFHYFGNLIRIPITLFAGILLLKKSLLVRSFFHFRILFIYPINVFKCKRI